VIGTIARDDLRLAGVHARDLEGGLVGIGSRGGEEELGQSFGKDLEKKLAQLGAGRRRVERRSVGQRLRLPLDGLDDGLVVVAQVGTHQLRRKVEVTLAVAVGEVAAVSGDEVIGVPELLFAPGSVVVVPGELDDLLGGELIRHGGSVMLVLLFEMMCAAEYTGLSRRVYES
jgi:hypothetical protein